MVVVVDVETSRDIKFDGKPGSSHMLVHPPLHNSTSQDKYTSILSGNLKAKSEAKAIMSAPVVPVCRVREK